MTLVTILLLFGAGILGGTINAIAGGATFFTFPAMLAAGLPPVLANASNTVALVPGHAFAVLAARRELPPLSRHLVFSMLIGIAGGVIGAVLLLWAGEKAFTTAVPFLIGGATLLFAFAPKLQAAIRREVAGHPEGPSHGKVAFAIQSFAAIYGGYFGAGLGIIMLAALSLVGYRDLKQTNTVKNLLSALINAVAVVIFVIAGSVSWPETLVMLCGAVCGGFLGGKLSRVLPARVVRVLVIAMGTLLTLYYFWRYYIA